MYSRAHRRPLFNRQRISLTTQDSIFHDTFLVSVHTTSMCCNCSQFVLTGKLTPYNYRSTVPCAHACARSGGCLRSPWTEKTNYRNNAYGNLLKMRMSSWCKHQLKVSLFRLDGTRDYGNFALVAHCVKQ